MPKQTNRTEEEQFQINYCLDEIETSIELLTHKGSDERRKNLDGWVRNQKAILKSLNYKGKIPRKRRNSK